MDVFWKFCEKKRKFEVVIMKLQVRKYKKNQIQTLNGNGQYNEKVWEKSE